MRKDYKISYLEEDSFFKPIMVGIIKAGTIILTVCVLWVLVVIFFCL